MNRAEKKIKFRKIPAKKYRVILVFFKEISFVEGFVMVHGTWKCVFSFYFKYCVGRAVSVYPSWKNQNSQQGLSCSFLSVCVKAEGVWSLLPNV